MVLLEGLGKLKITTLSGTRTGDLPASSSATPVSVLTSIRQLRQHTIYVFVLVRNLYFHFNGLE
jgi:hypothetical protein